jgi:uncharacterized membrane protein YdbT with pleckstrin-like domain
MSYVEKNLIPGETVVYKTRLHWIVLFRPILLGLLFGLPGLGMLVRSMATSGDKGGMSSWVVALAFIFLILSAICVGVGLVRRNATEMAVTDKRVIIKAGVVSRKTFELLLSKVESIGVNESLWGRMMGYGTVVVRGTGGTPEPFDKVAHPFEFRKQVEQQIERLQERLR